MDDAAGRTAANTAGTADREALDALVFDWGEAYVIVHEGGCWQAGRRDTIGRLLKASDAAGLRAAIRADYELKRVPRNLPGDGGEP